MRKESIVQKYIVALNVYSCNGRYEFMKQNRELN